MESALCSQHHHLSQPESDLRLRWFLKSQGEQRWDLRELSLLNQHGWHVCLKGLGYTGRRLVL